MVPVLASVLESATGVGATATGATGAGAASAVAAKMEAEMRVVNCIFSDWELGRF